MDRCEKERFSRRFWRNHITNICGSEDGLMMWNSVAFFVGPDIYA
jgi:hypothetical protein